MLMPNLVKAARSLLCVRQSELAKASGISLATLNNFERGIGDPRVSTIDAVERALRKEGITFNINGEYDGVTLQKLLRPKIFDTYTASRQVLELFDRSSLLNIQSIVFYRHIEKINHEDVRQYAAVAINGLARTIIFDQARLSFDTSSHAAEVAGIMFAAFSIYPDRLYYIPDLISNSLNLSASQLVNLIKETEYEILDDPADFIEKFELETKNIRSWLDRPDHPLKSLLVVTKSRLL